MNEFLTFRKFVTPMAIQILFWIGVGVCAVEGITMLVSSAASTFGRGIGIINGLLVLFIGPIAVRVLCELIMAVFKIHDGLKQGGER
jgi:hypothetical protein